jgi:hypothetical protein
MREFKDNFGNIYDLDNLDTYDYLPKTIRECDSEMFRLIGETLCYMDYFHPDVFPINCPQRIRVQEMIKYFCDNRKDNFNNLIWFQERIFLFQCETENMC